MSNPFVITFGSTPPQYIPRISQREKIIQDFNSATPSTHAYAIIGVRGSGKTVLLNEIRNKIGSSWITLDLNSQDDLLRSMAAKLYSDRSMHKLFLKAKLDFSMLGLGVHVEDSAPAYDYETAITMMLEETAKQNKKVFITLDEVSGTDNIRKFTGAFQIFIRNGLPVFLTMAGIPENVYGLFDDRLSTFLYRTPRVEMTPLNMDMIRRSYMRTLRVDEKTAVYLAELTRGYSFAYQVLGHVCWGKDIKTDENDSSFDDILAEYDYYLQEFSYVKIWSEMSPTDRKLAHAVASGRHIAADIQQATDMDSKKYSVYRDRLKKKGLLDTSRYGEIHFSLPRFDTFVNSQL